MSTNQNQPAPAESAIENVRAEWIPSSFAADGTPEVPTDPAWNRFSDYIESYPGWSASLNIEGDPPTGQVDPEDHFRGVEESSLTIEWWLQRFFVDSTGAPNDLVGELIQYDGVSTNPVHEVLIRKEVRGGGRDGAGFRTYFVGSGCRPTSATIPGDPASSRPIIVEGQYAAEKVRQYVVHQPSTAAELAVKSTDPNDTNEVIIESEGATTTASVVLPGGSPNTVATTTTVGDIDAIEVKGEHAGDITVGISDGASPPTITTQLTEDPITGTASDGVDSDRGIPALGAGSHAPEIGQAPEQFQFLGTSSSFGGGALAESAASDRVHAFDLSIDVDVTREPRQATRRQSIDMGTRSISADADVAGPFESAKQNYDFYVGLEGDLVYNFPDSASVTLRNAQLTDTDEVSFAAGDGNIVYGVTFEPSGVPALTFTAASP